MLSTGQLYRTWMKRLREWVPDQCASRLTNMQWLISGMYQARAVHLSYIARKLPLRAKKLSVVRRLRRLLDNPAVRVREWYHPTAQWLIRAAASGGAVHLVLDSTKVSGRHRCVMVALAYRRRTLPLAWTWVRSQFAHATAEKEAALLAYVRTLLPCGVQVTLVGDNEFGAVRFVRQIGRWGWDYALRQPGHTALRLPFQVAWRRLQHMGLQPGTMTSCDRVQLGKSDPLHTALVMYWERGEQRPWFLATNLTNPHAAIALYRRRMWIEEMFGDFKAHGVDLEISQLRHFLRLSRLTLAVALLYVWLVAIGDYVRHHLLTHLIDRTDRHDLSIFRHGWDFLERCLALQDPVPIVSVPNFCSVSGS